MTSITFKRARNEAQKDARRRKILNAALDLYEELGLDQVRVDSIAKRANIAKGTVYLYFKSREAIFIELYEEAFADWLIGFVRLPELSKTAAKDKIAAIIAEHFISDRRFATLHSALAHGLWAKLQPADKTAALDVIEPGRHAFADFIARVLKLPFADATTRSQAILAVLSGYQAMAIVSGPNPTLLTDMIEKQLT